MEFKILLQLRVAEVCLRKQMWIIPLTRHLGCNTIVRTVVSGREKGRDATTFMGEMAL